MVTQANLPTMLSLITPAIIEKLMTARSLTEQEAAALLYQSVFYETLEAEETKLWRLSPVLLYNLLEEELATGEITWPEEQ